MISIYEDTRNEFELANGRYRCLGAKKGMLGEGAFALVLHGEDTLTQERVAIKVGRANNRGGGKEITEGEWRLMSVLRHENVVQALAFWKTPAQVAKDVFYPSLVLEYCNGGTMSQLIEKMKYPVDEQEMKPLFSQLREGILYLHSKKIIHRDLKPENIMLHRTTAGLLLVKITDFGISKDTNNNFAQTFAGTEIYMAPEIRLRKTGAYTAKVDVWSFGAIVYEVMTGTRLRLRGDNPNAEDYITYDYDKLAECFSLELRNLVKACLNPKPDYRLPLDNKTLTSYLSIAKTVDLSKSSLSVVLSGVHESISPNQSSAAQDQVNPIDVERRALYGFIMSLANPDTNLLYRSVYTYAILADLATLLRIERFQHNLKRHLPKEYLNLYKNWILDLDARRKLIEKEPFEDKSAKVFIYDYAQLFFERASNLRASKHPDERREAKACAHAASQCLHAIAAFLDRSDCVNFDALSESVASLNEELALVD